jgi:mercuric ion transport protein
MKTGGLRLLETGAVGSAIAASFCCLGPLLLAVLGLGGGALFVRFAPYRPLFAVLTVLCLGGAFYLSYRRSPSDECGPGTACARSGKRRRTGLWIATAFVVVLTALSYLAQRLP